MQKPRFNKIQRVIAFVLLVSTLLCGGTAMSVSAEDSTGGGSISTTRKDLAEIQEIANAISYEAYLSRYESVGRGSQTVVVYDICVDCVCVMVVEYFWHTDLGEVFISI